MLQLLHDRSLTLSEASKVTTYPICFVVSDAVEDMESRLVHIDKQKHSMHKARLQIMMQNMLRKDYFED
tara:strand:- start:3390 stop:3596 length:207 start_codon:yes stop_codon:yes gene_type:complete